MSVVSIIGCGLLGLGVAMLLAPLILEVGARSKLSRAKDLHHINQAPVLRFGGLALVAAFLTVECFVGTVIATDANFAAERPAIILSCLAMFGLGFWDDLKPLGAKQKLLGQTLIAAAVCYSGIAIESFKIPFINQIIPLGGWGSVLTVFWLVGITNLINLIDGVDGLAGGICLMLMGLLAYVGYQNGAVVLSAAGMTGALLGFLWFNFPPARIYLGDGGAYFLGFQIGLFSLVCSQKGTIAGALVAPLFVLALPIVDASLAVLRRGLRGLPLFRPDNGHIHHHLLGSGMSRRKVVLSLYGVTLLFLGMGLAAFWSRGQLVPILLGASALVLVLCAGKLSFSREWLAVGRTLGNSLAMRQEVRYALCLAQLLAHEGERCASLRDLFDELALAARRLGFTSVRLTLADAQAVWKLREVCVPVLTAKHALRGGVCGVIEFEAPTCRLIRNLSSGESVTLKCCTSPCSPPIYDSRLFEIAAELLAEAWLTATRKWKTDDAPLQFNMKLPGVSGVQRRFGRLHESPS